MNKIDSKIMSATPEAIERLEYLINKSEKDVMAVKIGVENGADFSADFGAEFGAEIGVNFDNTLITWISQGKRRTVGKVSGLAGLNIKTY